METEIKQTSMTKDDKKIDYSLLAKQIFIFSLIVSGNYIGETFSCSIQNKLNNNMILKHILGIMTMYFFVTFVDNSNKNKNPIYGILIACGLYIWFIFISRTNRNIVFYILIIIFIMYVLNIYRQYYQEKHKKEKIKDKRLIDIFYLVNQILFYISIILTIYGFILYLGEKKYEYGKKFTYYKFFLGVPKCKFTHLDKKSLNQGDYLKKAFSLNTKYFKPHKSI